MNMVLYEYLIIFSLGLCAGNIYENGVKSLVLQYPTFGKSYKCTILIYKYTDILIY